MYNREPTNKSNNQKLCNCKIIVILLMLSVKIYNWLNK